MQKFTCTLFLTTLCCLTLFGNSFLNNITIEILEQENVECFGEDSGYIELEASDGTGPYTYNLDDEENTEGIFEDLEGGIYTLIVTDQTGCSATLDIEIEEPEELVITVVEMNDAGCVGVSNGQFLLETTGGIGSYLYTLGTEVNTTGLFENLAPGVYEPLVEDANGCEQFITITIGEDSGITAMIVEQMNIDCFGNSNGMVQAEGADGVSPYEYRVDGIVNTSGIFSDLEEGTYTILISDAVGCSTTQSVTISEPTELMATVAQTTDESCFGANDGSFQITANGGTTGYTFSTDNDSNTDGNFENQAAGIYEVTVTDANGCTVMVSVTIGSPMEIVVADPVVTNIDCFGNTNGMIEISATGGSGNITYTLGNETNMTGVFAGLAAGNYMVVVIDGTNCEMSVSVDITQPDELVGIIDAIFNINCSGGGTGAIDFGATGGTVDYTFTLNGVSNTDGLFENLTAGDYTVMIADANNCEASITATIQESAGLGVNIIAMNDVTCNGDMDGSVTIEANGGSGNYTYTVGTEMNTTGEFSNLEPGLYEGFATDDLDCSTMFEFTITEPTALTMMIEVAAPILCAGDANGSIQVVAMGGNADYSYSIGLQNNQTGLFENLSAGTYPVMVSDANGCTAIEDFILGEPVQLEVLIPDFSPVSCAGEMDGFIQAMGVGGIGDYLYTLGDETNATGLFENLSTGIYEIEVEDDNGCMASTQFTVSEPAEVVGVITDLQDEGCNMMLGSVQIEGTGGTGAITYTLNMESNMTGLFENLVAGIYEVQLVDENGCSAAVEVVIEQSEDMTGMIVAQGDAECFGENSGFFEVVAMGGNGTITYTLGNESNETGLFEDLGAGEYDVVVSSLGGCSLTFSVVIDEPEMMTFEVEVIQAPLCAGDMSGSIQITAMGGNGDYTYSLNDEMNDTGIFENLGGGTYDIQISDDNECMVGDEFTLEVPVVLELTVTSVQADTGDENGSFNVQGAGGVSPYQFSLDGVNFQMTPPFSNLMFGDYTAYIMDANGCIATVEVTVPFNSNTFSIESGVAGMAVFPNPFVENLTIELDLYRGQILDFTIFNINGKEMQKSQGNFAAGKSNVTISSLDNLSAGTYLLRVVGQEFQGHFKIVKQ